MFCQFHREKSPETFLLVDLTKLENHQFALIEKVFFFNIFFVTLRTLYTASGLGLNNKKKNTVNIKATYLTFLDC